MNLFVAGGLGLFIGGIAVAQAKDSEFSIDPTLVDKIFEASVRREEQPLPRAHLIFDAGYGQFHPTELTLRNHYYEVSYADKIASLPLGSLRVGRLVATSVVADWSMFAQFGYSYSQEFQSVGSSTGIQLRDAITLQWVPIQLGTRADLARIGPRFLRFGAMAALGAEWFHQSGTLDGVEQNFWVPTIAAGPELTFFPADAAVGGFNGVTVGADYRVGLASSQPISGWGLRISTGFVM